MGREETGCPEEPGHSSPRPPYKHPSLLPASLLQVLFGVSCCCLFSFLSLILSSDLSLAASSAEAAPERGRAGRGRLELGGGGSALAPVPTPHRLPRSPTAVPFFCKTMAL